MAQEDRARRAVRRARTACAAAAALVACLLAATPKPWDLAGGPAFFAAGRPLGATVAIAEWWAGALALALLAALTATASLWAAPPVAGERPERASRPGAGWLLLVALALLVAGLLRWNLAHGSVWADEAWSLRNTVSGMLERSSRDPQALVARRVSWSQTLWSYERPTNHALYSAAARLSLGAWRGLAGREAPAFDEFAFRLPAYLAALAAVATLAFLVRALGSARAGAAAAWLLALHPWHVREGADGRGYSFVVLFSALAALALVRALASGAARAWAAYAVCVALLLWAQPFAVHAVLALGAAALAAALAAGGPARARAVRTARVVAAHALAGVLFLALFAPNLAQLPEWESHFARAGKASVTPAAAGHLWTLLATGLEASEPDVPEHAPGLYPSLAERAREEPWVWPIALGLLPALAAAGALRVVRCPGPARFAALGLAASVPLCLLATRLSGGQWYSRFAIFGLVPTVAFLALGLEAALERLPWRSPRARARGVAAGLALGVAGFQLFVAPQTRVLLERPHTPSRELVRLLDAESGGDRRAALRAVLGTPGGNLHIEIYDPWIREVGDAAGLAALCDEAAREDRPLYVAYGYPYRNRNARPEAFRWLDDPRLFREVATLNGVELEHSLRVLRWTGQACPPGP